MALSKGQRPASKGTCVVYFLRLRSDIIYIGASEDLEQRLDDHASGQACRTTRLDPPAALLRVEVFPTFSEARTREAQLKRWSRAKTEALNQKRIRTTPRPEPISRIRQTAKHGKLIRDICLTKVRISAQPGQPFDAPPKHGLLMACGRQGTNTEVTRRRMARRRALSKRSASKGRFRRSWMVNGSGLARKRGSRAPAPLHETTRAQLTMQERARFFHGDAQRAPAGELGGDGG